ncbi:MAG: RDD family protein [Planctomycetota bacterium]
MKLKCPACAKLLQVPETAAGKVVKCPCGKSLRAPAFKQAASSASGTSQRPTTKGGSKTPKSVGGTRRRPTTSASAGFGVDGGLFDELTDADAAPVYVAPKVSAGAATNPYVNTGALKKYVDEDDLKAFEADSQRGGGSDYVIAGVGSRIGAYLIDTVFTTLMLGIEAVIIFFIFDHLKIEFDETLLRRKPAVALLVLLFAFPHMVNWVLISKYGQSLGKLMLGIVMLDEASGRVVKFGQGVGTRFIAWNCIVGIPGIGPIIGLVDLGFLFSERHRTLHDRLAKTVVAVKQ